MNVVASFLLLKLAGKDPKAADITALISSTGGEADEAKVELLMKEIEGKDVEELLKEGKDKLKSVSMGGGGGGGGVAAPAAAAAGAPPAAVKEEKEEEADLGGAMDMFGGGGDGY
ncbi:ribosomal protein p2-like [Nannochloropsis oceanica]